MNFSFSPFTAPASSLPESRFSRPGRGLPLSAISSLLLTSCVSVPPFLEATVDGDRGHLQTEAVKQETYLPFLRVPVWLPDPADRPAEHRYSLAAEKNQCR